MSIELNPADALKMFEEQELGLPDTEPKTEAKAAETAQVEDPAAAEVKAQETAAEVTPEGIATRDGKHVIPYSVLQSERTRAAQAERELTEARAQLAALQAAATDPKPTAKEGGADTTEVSKEEEDRLALLEEDFPTVAAELKATRELVKSLAAKLKPLEVSREADAAQRAAESAMTVQEAIDSVPKLAHIQAASPEAFELAQQFDNTLRNRADWAGKPMNERFAKVIELVEASLGEINVPGHKASAEQTPEALKAAAAAKVATAAKAVPTSLSQFPAGDPAAADETAAVEQMSHSQLASKMARMTPAQLDAYFASL